MVFKKSNFIEDNQDNQGNLRLQEKGTNKKDLSIPSKVLNFLLSIEEDSKVNYKFTPWAQVKFLCLAVFVPVLMILNAN